MTKMVGTQSSMTVPQFEPCLGDEELSQLTECIRTGWLTEGKKTEEFILRLSRYIGAKHVLLAPNGTLALYMALAVRGLGPGDEVIVPDFTFLGSASSVVLAGATPVFADVDRETFNLDPESLRRAISRRTRAIMPVHIYGQAADMDPLLAIAKEHNLFVIEDAAQGMGVYYKGRHVGTFGDLGCFSFFADKTMTTGEGGAIATDNDELADRLRYFRNQGRLDRGSFLHPHLGWNFRLTDLQSAIGLAQLDKLPYLIRRKHELEDAYRDRLAHVPEVRFPVVKDRDATVPFRINILVPEPEALMEHLTRNGVGVRRFFYPLHRQTCFDNHNSRTGDSMVNSVFAFEHGVSLPSSVMLGTKQIEYVCLKIAEFFGAAAKARGEG